MKKLLILTLFFIVGCNSGQFDNPNSGNSENWMAKTPHIIAVDGSTSCVWCEKKVMNERYGGQIQKGSKIWDFMSAECMIAWMQDNDTLPEHYDRVEVVDFIDGKNLYPAVEATYLRSMLRPSPGGMHLSAMRPADERLQANIHNAYPGTFMNWDEVWELVKANRGAMLAHQK